MPLVFLIGVLATLHLLSPTANWKRLEGMGFDLLTVLTATGQSNLPIFIVAIDDASLAAIKNRWPWPRRLHAQLINALHQAGATVIAFDVVFDYPTEEAEDAALAESIRQAGNVVLATGDVQQNTPFGTIWMHQRPLPRFLDQGAVEGLANMPFDPDLVMRRLPDKPEALWRRIVERLQAAMPDFPPLASIPDNAMIHYVGPSQSFPRLPFYQVLEPEKYLPAGALNDALVLVGRDTRSAVDISAAQADLFPTPFTFRDGELMPGVEIHANALNTALEGNVIRSTDARMAWAWLVGMTLLATVMTRYFRPLIASLGVLILAALYLMGTYVAFRFQLLWMPIATPLAGLFGVYSLEMLYNLWQEHRQRESIKRMFSLYVPAEVVKTLADHPEALRLGGEYREVTMMFTDLEGFTNISESLTAEQVTSLLNRHFTAMNEIIFRHGGTIDKFIGDAIMAFWNAPLEVPDHATRAVRAAMEMQAGMATLREEFTQSGLPPVRMRVGLHTGVVLVGNLGSLASRLNYTAVGDVVNLASRLEGINKRYGTDILVSGATVEQVKDIPCRRVDRVCAKGKTQAVDIFTPTQDPGLAEQAKTAFEAYRIRDWDQANALAVAMLDRYPGDGPTRQRLKQLEEYRQNPPPEDWDRATVLQEK